MCVNETWEDNYIWRNYGCNHDDNVGEYKFAQRIAKFTHCVSAMHINKGTKTITIFRINEVITTSLNYYIYIPICVGLYVAYIWKDKFSK